MSFTTIKILLSALLRTLLSLIIPRFVTEEFVLEYDEETDMLHAHYFVFEVMDVREYEYVGQVRFFYFLGFVCFPKVIMTCTSQAYCNGDAPWWRWK